MSESRNDLLLLTRPTVSFYLTDGGLSLAVK